MPSSSQLGDRGVNTLPDASLPVADSPALRAHLNFGGSGTYAGHVVAPDGTVFVSDTYHHCVRRLSADGGVVNYGQCNAASGPIAGDGALVSSSVISFNTPTGLALAPDGTLYVADTGHNVIRKISPDGRLNTFAGNGASATAGDGKKVGDPGISFKSPQALALGRDGTLYIADTISNVIRAVAPDGIIRTVAGMADTAWSLDREGSPALRSHFRTPASIAIGPYGSLYVLDKDDYCIRRIGGMFEHREAEGAVPSSDGREVWIFNADGQHLRTLDALTGLVLRSFEYVGARLIRIHEVVDRAVAPAIEDITTINYDEAGNIANIVSPRGQTTLVTASGGFVASVASPAVPEEKVTFDYYAGGMLHHLVDAKAQVHAFTYDVSGLLLTDANPAGGSKTFASYAMPAGWGVSRTTALGRNEYHEITRDPSGEVRLVVDSANLLTTTSTSADGTVITIRPTGEKSVMTPMPDPTFGAMASGVGQVTYYSASAGGGTVSILQSVAATWDNGAGDPHIPNPDPTTLRTLARTTSITGTSGTYDWKYDRLARTIVSIQPPAQPGWSSRVSTTKLDENGRIVSFVSPGRTPTHLSYDALGRISLVWQAEDDASACGNLTILPAPAGCRRLTRGYDGVSHLTSMVDSLGTATILSVDTIGRIVSADLPSLSAASTPRSLGHIFDLNGNASTVTPPGRPAHTFVFNANDDVADYKAPLLVPSIPFTTHIDYNADQQPALITTPMGSNIQLRYEGDPVVGGFNTGRLKRIEHALGIISIEYGPPTYPPALPSGDEGRMTLISGPGLTSIALQSDGALRKDRVIWTSPDAFGAQVHSVARVMDEHLRPIGIEIDGTAGASCAFDNAGAVIAAGGLYIARDPGSNRILSTSVAGAHTVLTDESMVGAVNSFGEHLIYSTKIDGGMPSTGEAQYYFNLERDALGRVSKKSESILGISTVRRYSYYAGGALRQVSTDSGSPLVMYSYDGNGNRLNRVVAGAAVLSDAVYDAQDRLVAYGGVAYDYNDNGQRVSKTVAGLTTSYTYDDLGNLLRVVRPGLDIQYVVDGLGRRIGKRVNGSLQRGWLYDGSRIIAETDSTGLVVSRFLYATKWNVPDVMVRSVAGGSITYRIVSDDLGSVRMVVNLTTGAVDQQLNYDNDGSGTVLATSSGASDLQPFAFAGGLYDAQTGLIRFGARDYDPQTGGWTAKDPTLFDGGSNFYAYCNSDPVNFVDPTGQNPLVIAGPPAVIVGPAIIVAGVVVVTGVAVVALHEWTKPVPAAGDAGLDQDAILDLIFDPTANSDSDVDDAPNVCPSAPRARDATDEKRRKKKPGCYCSCLQTGYAPTLIGRVANAADCVAICQPMNMGSVCK